jgi:hypothetical protein
LRWLRTSAFHRSEKSATVATLPGLYPALLTRANNKSSRRCASFRVGYLSFDDKRLANAPDSNIGLNVLSPPCNP